MSYHLLLDLPRDLLASIINFIESIDILRLVSTGNHALREKLKLEHVVTRLNISTFGKYLLPPDAIEKWSLFFPHLRHLIIDGSLRSLSALNIDAIHLHPDLETFAIVGEVISFRHYLNSRITRFHDLSLLPRSLQILDLRDYCLDDPEQLPPMLKELRVKTYNNNKLENLPVLLTKLVIDSCDRLDKVELPSSLLHLQFPDVGFESKLIQNLPPGLQILILGGTHTSALHGNMHQLPSMQDSIVWYKSCSVDQMIAILPRSLVYLSLWGTLSDSGITNFPPQLKHFSLFGRLKYSSNTFRLLPRSLVEFCIHDYSVETIIYPMDVLQLPSLTIFYVHCCLKNAAETLLLLPPSITKVNLGLNRCSPGPTGTLHFPPNLKWLRISHCNWPEDISFPLSLQYLRLEVNTKVVTVIFFASLPANLEALVIDSLDRTIEHPLLFSHLPRTLKHLELLLVDGFDQTNVQYLPNLTTLILDQDNSITDNVVKYLPRSLLNLSLKSNHILTNDCVDHLPPRLRHFCLSYHSKSITPAVADRLPYGRYYPSSVRCAMLQGCCRISTMS
jgi:hypothetical protein